jgi:hypothetical protein
MQTGLKGHSSTAAKCRVTALLIALLFLSTGCFQSDQPTQRGTLQLSKLGPETIWPMGAPGSGTPTLRNVAAEDLAFSSETRSIQDRIPALSGEAFNVYSPYPIGSQSSLIRAPEVFRVGRTSSYFLQGSSAQIPSSPDLALASVFEKPFSLLFASIFKKGASETGNLLADASGEENRNPFREAKQKIEPSAAASDTTKSAAASQTQKTSSADGTQDKASSATVAAGGPSAPLGRFIFLGDFDGHGVLGVHRADRSGDTAFSFSDAQRTFSLYINPGAVDFQRSFALDDMNGDGRPDLLVTSRASLFGGVLIGNGNGGFDLAGSFLTAYEPTIATLGASFNGMRDIVAVNTRTGEVSTYRAATQYRPSGLQTLDFLPDYIGHLVSLQDGLDYLMAARSGNPEILYRWNDSGRLENSGIDLPGDPTLSFTGGSYAQNLTSALRVYQVGPYASVTLSNSRGQTFNVANMKLWPNAFLAVGDLAGQGTLDVAVAFLVSSTPVK